MEQNNVLSMATAWEDAMSHEEQSKKKKFALAGGGYAYVELQSGRTKVVLPVLDGANSLWGIGIALVYDNTYHTTKLNVNEMFTGGEQGVYVNGYGDTYRLTNGCTEHGQKSVNGAEMIGRLSARGVSVSDFDEVKCLRKGTQIKIFNEDGYLAAICDDFCNYLLFTYTAGVAGQLEKITDNYGNVMQFYYDSEGKLTHIEDMRNKEYWCYYNSDSQLTGLQHGDGRVTEIEYNGDMLFSVSTQEGYKSEIHAFNNPEATEKIVQYAGEEELSYLQFTYETDVLIVTDEDDEVTEYHFGTNGTNGVRAYKIFQKSIQKLQKKEIAEVAIEFHISDTVKKILIVKNFKPLNVGVKRWITAAPYYWATGSHRGSITANTIKKLDERKYWDNSSIKVVKERMEFEKEKILKDEQIE